VHTAAQDASHGWTGGPALWAGVSPASLVAVGLAAAAIGAGLRALGAPLGLALAASFAAATLSLGWLAVLAAAASLARPERARSLAGFGALAASLSLGVWAAHTWLTTDAALNLELVASLARTGLARPLGAAVYVVEQWPATVLAAALGVLLGVRRPEVRAAAFLALAYLVVLGVLALTPSPRYFLGLFPLLFALAAVLPIACAAAAAARWPRLRAVAAVSSSVMLLGGLLIEHEIGGRDTLILEPGGPLRTSRLRTAPSPDWASALAEAPLEGRLVCNDELACRMLGLRPDHWWLRSDAEARVYGRRGDHDRGWRSGYTGSPIVTDRGELRALANDGRGAWVLVLDTVKHGFEEPLASIGALDAGLKPRLTAPGLRLYRIEPARTERSLD
jgi:hypothetical protein